MLPSNVQQPFSIVFCSVVSNVSDIGRTTILDVILRTNPTINASVDIKSDPFVWDWEGMQRSETFPFRVIVDGFCVLSCDVERKFIEIFHMNFSGFSKQLCKIVCFYDLALFIFPNL